MRVFCILLSAFVISASFAPPVLAADQVQATPNKDVEVAYGADKITYRSPKYGEFSVPKDYRVWAKELWNQTNPLGENYPRDRWSSAATTKRIVEVRVPGSKHYTVTFRFVPGQLDAEAAKKVATRIMDNWSTVQRFGMPPVENERKIMVGGGGAHALDYAWSSGNSPGIFFVTPKGTILIYSRIQSRDFVLEDLVKTIKILR